MSRRHPLLVDMGIVGAVQVLHEYLAALEQDACMLSRNSSFISAVVGQVHFGENVADRVLSSDGDFGSAGWKGYGGVGALYDQVTLDNGPR